MLVNIGILGLTSYLVFILNLIIKGLKNKNEYTIICLVTLICFLIQDFFNLWVVIVTPIFWVLMSVLYLTFNNSHNNKYTKEMEN